MMVTSYGCDRWLKFTQKSTENTIQPRIHLSDPVKFSWYEVKEVHDINYKELLVGIPTCCRDS